MQKRKAFITGISGQDGSYLAEHLLNDGYEVYGTVRRHSLSETQDNRIAHIIGHVSTDYSDLSDIGSLSRLMKSIQPDEIYNLAAQSQVRISFDVPQYTIQTNALGVANMLEVYRDICPGAKFYQASSSEMFGNSKDQDGYQRETTPMKPVSPYGCAKLMAYHLVRVYRNSYNLFASNGILFNHESPRRGENFVTQKITKKAVQIKLGLIDKIALGNIDSYRDWGHSKDYTSAMRLILAHKEPDDFVISSTNTKSIRELLDLVFKKLGMDYRDFLVQEDKYRRPQELDYLRGDSTKARDVLGWKETYTFEGIIDEMIDNWMDYYKNTDLPSYSAKR